MEKEQTCKLVWATSWNRCTSRNLLFCVVGAPRGESSHLACIQKGMSVISQTYGTLEKQGPLTIKCKFHKRKGKGTGYGNVGTITFVPDHFHKSSKDLFFSVLELVSFYRFKQKIKLSNIGRDMGLAPILFSFNYNVMTWIRTPILKTPVLGSFELDCSATPAT